MKLAIVAPVTNTPVNSAGSSNRSRSHSPAVRSTLAASAEESQPYASWSNAAVSQSAPSAAGVVPPTTKWKNRGPLDRVAVAAPRSASSASASIAPEPFSGRG